MSITRKRIFSIVLSLIFMILTCSGCANSQLRKILDKYESLADTYFDFVEKYGENPEYGEYPESEYMELMSEWAEVTANLERIDIDKLSDEDLMYFTQVISRVSLKMDAIEFDDTRAEETNPQQDMSVGMMPDIPQPDSELIPDGAETQNADTWQYYSDSKEGIAFSFPGDWSLDDPENSMNDLFTTVVIAPEEEGFNANMSVSKSDYDEVAEIMMTCTEDQLLLILSQTGYGNPEIYYLTDTVIDNVPARKQCFTFDFTDTESSFSGRFVDIMYTYVYNNNFYVIRYATLEHLYEKYATIFDSIMETYTIS